MISFGGVDVTQVIVDFSSRGLNTEWKNLLRALAIPSLSDVNELPFVRRNKLFEVV